MSLYTSNGIVLKEIPTGENSKNIIVFLKDYGKVLISVRGGKKLNSKFFSGTQTFSYSNFNVYNNGKLSVLSQVDVINNFYNISKNYSSLCLASSMLEICNKVIEPMFETNEILLLLIKCLDKLNKSFDSFFINIIFEFKFMQYSGYELSLYCIFCGEDNYTEHNYISNEGIICQNCIKKEDSYGVSISSLKAIKYIYNSFFDNFLI